MKQVIQNVRTGILTTQDIPTPVASPGMVLIANQASLVSAGTEKMIMDLSRKSLLGKARERPDQVARVLEKVRNEGLFSTFNQVRSKLDTPMTMGYSSAGIVLAVGEGVQEFKPGDHAASNGPHAEVVSVSRNLCAKVPPSLPLEHACFAVLGSIALQGVRLSKVMLGETVFVIGLGLVGQLTVALLKSAGIRVIGTDPDADKCTLAMSLGAYVARPGICAGDVEEYTGRLGADAVIITASTQSNQPIELAAAAIRQKGRVVLVGVVGLELDRRPFFFKEAEFVVSCSYGPGRYDDNYEQRGIDYPAAYVRWTEQRNIQSVVDLMASGTLDVSKLISHQFPIADAAQAYAMIEHASAPYTGIVLTYPHLGTVEHYTAVDLHARTSRSRVAPQEGLIRYGLLGAGNFTQMVMLPAISKSGAYSPVSIVSAKGVSGTHLGTNAGFERSASNEADVFSDDSISAVFSITRHDQHASHVCKAIRSGKHVFVEKPLCTSFEELASIDAAIADIEQPPLIMVGFNRRFAPMCQLLRQVFETVNPVTVNIRFNAGPIPGSHWTQNDVEGGGRIIGEACHAIDLATWITQSQPVRVYAESVAGGHDMISDDQCFITLRHANGSISSIAYLSSGSKSFPKERIEVIGGGKIGIIDDYRLLTLNTGGKSSNRRMSMDKGHQQEINAWAAAMQQGSESPINWGELRAVTLASLYAVRSLREGLAFDIA